jgi:dTMP kinase
MHNPVEQFVGDNEQRMSTLYQKILPEMRNPSHDKVHIDMALTRARELFDWCNQQGQSADWEIIFASLCLHDLGRSDPYLHGPASLQASIEQAKQILASCGYIPEEAERICQIIETHDQPESTPDDLEGLIVKEADFLAGMGAWGIYRTIAWGIESGRDTAAIIATLKEKMPARIASLRLPPSQEFAWKEWPLVNLFLAQLERQMAYQEQEQRTGLYIVLEGISGSGKDTQAKLLAEYLADQNTKVQVLAEPTNTGRDLIKIIKTAGRQITQRERTLIFAADRIATVEKIKAALESGITVIEVRSLLSAMAYQGETPSEMADILFLNRFVPRPDLIIYLDTTPKIALARTRKREEKGVPKGDFEEELKMIATLKRFQQAFAMLPGIRIEVVPGDGLVEEVFEQVKKVIESTNGRS